MSKLIHIDDTLLSDHFKEAHGFRPRGIYQEWWSDDELLVEHDKLSGICAINSERERVEGLESLRELEEGITRTIECGAGDRSTAIRWMFSDLDMCQGIDYELWHLNIPFCLTSSYAAEIVEAIE